MSFYEEKRVRLRKDRRCNGCRFTELKKGQTVFHMVGKHSYDFFSTYLCSECEEFMKKNPGYFNDDGWYEGDIGTAREEEKEERN